MNSRIIALTCALAASACGASRDRQAEVPPSAQTPTTTQAETRSESRPPSDARSSTSSSTTVDSANLAPTPPRSPATVGTATTGTATTGSPDVSPPPADRPHADAQDQPKRPDNTAVNERDRRGAALTPVDQGNSASETKISAAIRKAMVADKSLSFTAKNAKVITVGTKVTLRGPVKSEQEKASIEALAKQTAGVSEVDNQLEVKK